MTRPGRATRLTLTTAALIVPISAGLSFLAGPLDQDWLYGYFWVNQEILDHSWEFHINIPAAVSALILLSAGLVWCVVALRRQVGRPTWPLIFGLFIIFMAFDEALSFHERIETSLGIDWQVLYLPVMAFGGLAWIALLLRLRGVQRQAGLALAVGAAFWVISQVLEFIQWDGSVRQPGWTAYVIAEEILESWGSIAFLLAGILAGLSGPRRGQAQS